MQLTRAFLGLLTLCVASLAAPIASNVELSVKHSSHEANAVPLPGPDSKGEKFTDDLQALHSEGEEDYSARFIGCYPCKDLKSEPEELPTDDI